MYVLYEYEISNEKTSQCILLMVVNFVISILINKRGGSCFKRSIQLIQNKMGWYHEYVQLGDTPLFDIRTINVPFLGLIIDAQTHNYNHLN